MAALFNEVNLVRSFYPVFKGDFNFLNDPALIFLTEVANGISGLNHNIVIMSESCSLKISSIPFIKRNKWFSR